MDGLIDKTAGRGRTWLRFRDEAAADAFVESARGFATTRPARGPSGAWVVLALANPLPCHKETTTHGDSAL